MLLWAVVKLGIARWWLRRMSESRACRNRVRPRYTQLDNAVARANLSLTLTNSSSFLLDYQTYVLYLTLNGSSTEIGAEFAGFNYTGFENEEQLGTA